MSADDFLQLLTEVLYLLVFAVVATQAVQQPHRAAIDIALLFGATTLIIAQRWIDLLFGVMLKQWLGMVNSSLLMALPYLLLRLVDDFSDVPRWLMRGAEIGLGLAVAGLFLLTQPFSLPITLLYVAYFVSLVIYAATMFARESRRSSGVTKRRLQAVAVGSTFLALLLVTAGLQAVLPELRDTWTVLGRLCSLASGLGYFLGFAPPPLLRRAWQEPELRSFLGRAASLPRLPSTETIVRELELGAAKSTGAPEAAIGLWDEAAGALRYQRQGQRFAIPKGELIAGRAFARQQAIFEPSTLAADPLHAELYRHANAKAVLVAPITAGDRRLGVLTVYAPRAPIFAADDLVLVRLLADQAAVVLESRALIDEAARVRAREEATRLKDDFLSAAAHDLKTPLTTLVAQAQLLDRRARLHPEAPADAAGLERLVKESKRLSSLVLELLDAAQAERGKLVGQRELVDLLELARENCARHTSERHQCLVEGVAPVVGELDRSRIEQLLENLVENAVKYSPDGGEIRVRVWLEQDTAQFTVTDRGIGIPAADLPLLFERFHRGTNVDDRRFAGMGLGLFICRGIVEQHGGRIWAMSRSGAGTTFHVSLPVTAHAAVREEVAHG
ncbi:MAG: GAF domain-containing protein [Chloroflexi bacterium]|nr:GAF domain-containing protein [Chloroflexota bacterium]